MLMSGLLMGCYPAVAPVPLDTPVPRSTRAAPALPLPRITPTPQATRLAENPATVAPAPSATVHQSSPITPERTLPVAVTQLPPTRAPSPAATRLRLTPTSIENVTPLPALPAPQPPKAYEIDLTLPTYDYARALQSTPPDDPVYPYPRLNFEQIGPPMPRAYKAIVLENSYTSITILPELGGRILRWIDKATGENLFYANPVIKPTRWGYRGWWLATGGMEWALPVEEHGLNEYRPWTYRIERGAGSVTVRVGDTESRTGLSVEVAITLDARHSYFTVRPVVSNPGGAAQTYQLWLNAMLSLGGNSVSGDTQFIVPTGQVTIHSTGDGSLGGAYQQVSWPVINGRDMSWYRNWNAWLGFFDSPNAHGGFIGAYDHDADLGVVRVYPVGVAFGAKVFGGRGIDPGVWTDDGSSYFELWGGLLPTFADYTTLAPGASIGWTERWFAVSGIGGFNFANANGAVRLTESDGRVTVALATTYRVTGTLVVWRGGQAIAWLPVAVAPGKPVMQTVDSPTGGTLGVQLIDGAGNVVLQYGAVGGN